MLDGHGIKTKIGELLDAMDKLKMTETFFGFRMLSGDYNAEQKNLKERIPKAAECIEDLQNSIADVTRFIDKAKRYTEINELSGELLNLFIEKIEVGERAERYSRTSEQKVIIHYRDIGVIGAFAEEAEKIAEQRQRQTA